MCKIRGNLLVLMPSPSRIGAGADRVRLHSFVVLDPGGRDRVAVGWAIRPSRPYPSSDPTGESACP